MFVKVTKCRRHRTTSAHLPRPVLPVSSDWLAATVGMDDVLRDRRSWGCLICHAEQPGRLMSRGSFTANTGSQMIYDDERRPAVWEDFNNLQLGPFQINDAV